MLRLIILSFRNGKKYFPFLIVSFICFLILFGTLFINRYINYYSNIEIKNQLKNRILYIGSRSELDDEKEFFTSVYSIENIKEVYRYYYPVEIKVQKNIENQLLYMPSSTFKITGGRIYSDSTSHEVIISNKLSEKLNIKVQNLPQKISFEHLSNTYTVSVVGLYESSYEGFQDYIYTSALTMQNNFGEESQKIIYNAVIDNYDSLDEVVKKLSDINIDANLFDTSSVTEIKMQDNLITYLKLMIIALIIGIFAFIQLVVGNIIFTEKKDIALYKTMGYKPKDIIIILLSKIYIILIIAFFLSFILSGISLIIIKMFISSVTLLHFINHYIFEIFLIYGFELLILIFLPLFTVLLAIKKINSINTTKLFHSE